MKSPVLLLLILFLALPGLKSYAQEKKKTRIEILNADVWEFQSGKSANAERLLGNVRFRHENAVMNCDSAYLYKESNSIRAWGSIYINQGDSIHIYGDSLYYTGNTRIAELFGNVRLSDPGMDLNAPYLKYNLGTNQANYTGGGVLVNKRENNTLRSRIGIYHTKTKDFFFRDSVVLVSSDYTIYSDTLRYNTQSEITYFFGPTLIKSEENTIYCENGWYNTRTDQAAFSKNAWLESDGQKMSGDSLFYDRRSGTGRGMGNVQIVDTVQKMIINGEKAFLYKGGDSSLITENALLTMLFDQDSLFLHGDTLVATLDSVTQTRTMTAFHHVQFFKTDMQGKCDSLVYTGSDSLINLFTDPVLWADENQMTAEQISLKIYEGKIEKMEMRNTAFIASRDDSLYNQIKGKNMTGFFQDNELKRVDVFGNGETIYFARQDSGGFFGMNAATSTDLRIYVDKKEINEILFINQPEGVLYPLQQTLKENRTLKDFRWLGDLRPVSKEDVFVVKSIQPAQADADTSLTPSDP